MRKIEMDCYGLTDVGRKRSQKEGQFLVASVAEVVRFEVTSLDHCDRYGPLRNTKKLLIVADGVDGHASGREVSTSAIASLSP